MFPKWLVFGDSRSINRSGRECRRCAFPGSRLFAPVRTWVVRRQLHESHSGWRKKMYQSVEFVDNPTEQAIQVILEPWGLSIPLPANASFKVVARSPHEGQMEREDTSDGVIVYAWPGSTISVYQDNKLVEEIPIAVPSVPDGMNVRSFLGMVFGGKPKNGAA